MITEHRGLCIVPATPGHITAFDHAAPGLELSLRDGWSFTLMRKKKPVLIAGLLPMLPGTAMAWLVASDLIRRYPVAAAASCRAGLARLRLEHKLHRVQVFIYPGFPTAIRFAEWLGFQYEGTMKKVSADKQDYYLYALTEE